MRPYVGRASRIAGGGGSLARLGVTSLRGGSGRRRCVCGGVTVVTVRLAEVASGWSSVWWAHLSDLQLGWARSHLTGQPQVELGAAAPGEDGGVSASWWLWVFHNRYDTATEFTSALSSSSLLHKRTGEFCFLPLTWCKHSLPVWCERIRAKFVVTSLDRSFQPWLKMKCFYHWNNKRHSHQSCVGTRASFWRRASPALTCMSRTGSSPHAPEPFQTRGALDTKGPETRGRAGTFWHETMLTTWNHWSSFQPRPLRPLSLIMFDFEFQM